MESYQLLEEEFGHWAGVANVVGCSSGTAALHLAFESMRLPLGSEVICPDFTMVACPRAISLAGLEPVFIDCRDDLLVDPELIEDAVTDRTRAVLAVHIYGRRVNMEAVHELATQYDLAVVEDLAEAHGVPPHPATDAACWSFFRNKIIAGEEGGAVAFRCRNEADLARQLRCLGFTEAHDFNHAPRGHNYRMSNAHATLILRSLHWAAADSAAGTGESSLFFRRQIESWCDAELERRQLENFRVGKLLLWRQPSRNVVWVYDLRIPDMEKWQQDRLVGALNTAGIAARHAFQPMHQQDEYRDCRVVGGQVSEQMAREVIYLPVTPGVTTEETVHRAFDVISRALS